MSNSIHVPGTWEGETKIVVGIDIGTTQSGVAYAYLQTGGKKVIQRVTEWPDQGQGQGSSKVPTLIWYDTNKKAVSFGADALTREKEEEAYDQHWCLAKHFKLHLHPRDLVAKSHLTLDLLPPGVSRDKIYADFLRYLLEGTQKHFESRILDGKAVWARHRSSVEFVIAHPNGWGLNEQTILRNVAVEAGYTDQATASSQIRFVTEAEASVHYCIHNAGLDGRLKTGTNFLVSDAGGSTVDSTLYTVTESEPVLKLKEQRASGCVQAGAIFVDIEVEKYLRVGLTNAGLSTKDVDEYTKAAVKDFEGIAKRQFRDETGRYYIQIPDMGFTNAALGVRRGRMAVEGSTMKRFFDVCCREIFSSVDEQVEGHNVPHILLVGGFGDSPYLRNEFMKRYEPRGSSITCTNDSNSKVVADGAVIWGIVSNVVSRAPRYSFGAIYGKTVLPWNPLLRQRRFYLSPKGLPVLPGAWSQIVQKGVALDSDAIRRDDYIAIFDKPDPDLKSMTMDLYAYSGDDDPDWARDGEGNLLPGFRKVCVIKGDMRNLEGTLKKKEGLFDDPYWAVELDVCMRFGGTELKAYLEWEDNGRKCQGPAEVIPESEV